MKNRRLACWDFRRLEHSRAIFDLLRRGLDTACLQNAGEFF